MNDAPKIAKQLQERLVNAIESHADIAAIEALLSQGAVANDVRVMQAIEAQTDKVDQAWSQALIAIPDIAEAWRLREAADQAAYDLIESLEQNDLDSVKAALKEMAAAGDDADMDMGDGSMLAIAIQHRCSLEILKVLIEVGKADPAGFSNDAVDALEDADDGPWKDQVQALLRG